MNGGNDLAGQKGILNQGPGQSRSGDLSALKGEGGIEEFLLAVKVFHIYHHSGTGLVEPPSILLIHRHERRDVEILCKLEEETGAVGLIQGSIQNVAVLLIPGGVAHFCDDRFHLLLVRFEAIVETNRVETVTEVTEVSEKANRTLGNPTGLFLNQFLNRFFEGQLRCSGVVFPSKLGQVESSSRPEPSTSKDFLQLIQVQIHHENPIVEGVPPGRKATVPNCSFVNTAVHASRVFLQIAYTPSGRY